MAHEITASDGLVLTGKPAWHGLGVVVEDAPSAADALRIARLDWRVERMPVSVLTPDGGMDIADDYRGIRRTDTGELFAVVGQGYKPVQNAELAEFADALGADGSVKIESAGSIRGGRRVWFLARGESVWASDKDEVRPYLLVANGHDGTLAVTCQPTSVRVVCRNTLHMALGKGKASAVRFRHEGNVSDKLDAARRALGVFGKARDAFAGQVAALNARTMTTEAVQRYFLEAYQTTVEPIPAAPANKAEREAVADARATLATWSRNYSREVERRGTGATAWAALNAVTEWFDHQKQVRAANESARAENRIFGNVWGSSADAKGKALELALGTV